MTSLWVKTIRNHRTDRQATVPCARADAHEALQQRGRLVSVPFALLRNARERNGLHFAHLLVVAGRQDGRFLRHADAAGLAFGEDSRGVLDAVAEDSDGPGRRAKPRGEPARHGAGVVPAPRRDGPGRASFRGE